MEWMLDTAHGTHLFFVVSVLAAAGSASVFALMVTMRNVVGHEGPERCFGLLVSQHKPQNASWYMLGVMHATSCSVAGLNYQRRPLREPMQAVVSVVKDSSDNKTSGKAAAALRVAHCLSTSANAYTLRHPKTDIYSELQACCTERRGEDRV